MGQKEGTLGTDGRELGTDGRELGTDGRELGTEGRDVWEKKVGTSGSGTEGLTLHGDRSYRRCRKK